MKNKEYIEYTKTHRKAFRKVEKELLSAALNRGKPIKKIGLIVNNNTIRSFFHDLDKLIMYRFLDPITTNRIHNKLSRHHKRAKTRADYFQQIIEWECAPLTKSDKPLHAREFIMKKKKNKLPIYEPLLNELNL